MFYAITHSQLCCVGAVWAEDKIAIRVSGIFLSRKRREARLMIKKNFPEAVKHARGGKMPVLKRIACYLGGADVPFGRTLLDRSALSGFQRKVLGALAKVPRGRVIAYKTLACRLGLTSSRAVGTALARNPFPIIIPCHRVVNFDGGLGGFTPGQDIKIGLLKMEGVNPDKRNRIPKEFFVC